MAIDLTGLSFAAMEPSLLEFGGIQRGSLGGPSQNLQRLGNRFSFALALPPLAADSPWSVQLVRAKQEGALIRISEPVNTIAAGVTPTVLNAVSGGTAVTITGLPANFALPAKWLSFIHGGRRYAHLCDAAVASPSGTATLSITPMLRTPLAAGDLVEIAQPKAEGLLTDRLSWSVGKSRLIAFTLSLEERA